MIKVVAFYNHAQIDITAQTGNYKRSDNINSLGQAFTFDLLDNPIDKKTANIAVPMGAKIVVSHNDKVIFTGVIVSYSRSNLSTYSYTAYDYAFYLNKSEVIIQFNNVSIKTAIEKLCTNESIPVNIGCSINTKIKKIYNGEVINNIIDDLLKTATDETGKKYRKEYNEGKLYIDEQSNLIIQATYKPAKNVGAFNPAELVGDFNSTYSIEEMKNRIVIISSSEKNVQILAEKKDEENITTFGQLTHYEKLDDKNNTQAINIAEKKLKDLNKITRSFRVTLYGDDAIRSGRCLEFNQPDINLIGIFQINNCAHSYNGRVHLMELDLEAVE